MTIVLIKYARYSKLKLVLITFENVVSGNVSTFPFQSRYENFGIFSIYFK